MKANLYNDYKEKVVPRLMARFGYKNIMQVPRVQKVVLNVGVGKFVKEPHYIESVEQTIIQITGQKPVRTQAKKSISNFKIREGMDIGVKVTLRGERMYHFLERLVKLTFPRVRDFRGLADKGFDKNGNCTIGFKENIAFPEIKEIEKTHGVEMTFSTTAKNKEEAKELLVQLGFPFVK
ncbi:MAG: 50S ribosomal protein L5 [Candidatus Magasanikbacteria bacterium GW2011_GWA2_46_17]|uniref:Large ribosomal subunit protein uL5 n=1 Tax=Candidatus Magasanikbacteria bacterium GW2011_GWA2_46_17 TaxID=1619042 RepID=A0A0G1P371_9BACT|nr:MAG: 50S ribosomal protein L5 [Candidatus Magasanikbacteria bacterium GW2011_GWA2_46_17]